MLLVDKPLAKKEAEKWMRVEKTYKLISYQGTNILYKKEKGSMPAQRVIAMDEMFDKLENIHHSEGRYCGRIRLYKHVAQHYHGITEGICGFYVSTCQTCYLKKAKKSIKTIVTKPIKSIDYLSRGQVHLIDLSDMNPVMNVSPDGKRHINTYSYI